MIIKTKLTKLNTMISIDIKVSSYYDLFIEKYTILMIKAIPIE
jgi:hypothetical protein